MDEREIEAVAEVLAWEFGISERPSQRIIDASAKAVAALDRVRDARGDDEGKRDIMDVFRSDEAMRAFGVDRSPQGEDREGARRAIADAVRALDAGLPGEAWAALKSAQRSLEAEEEEE